MSAIEPWQCLFVLFVIALLVYGPIWIRKRFGTPYDPAPVPPQGVTGPDACPGCLGSGNSRHFQKPPNEDLGGGWTFRRCVRCGGTGRRFGRRLSEWPHLSGLVVHAEAVRRLSRTSARNAVWEGRP